MYLRPLALDITESKKFGSREAVESSLLRNFRRILNSFHLC